MAAHVQRHSKNLRPHAKTHKCPEIARRQIAAGARGTGVAAGEPALALARAVAAQRALRLRGLQGYAGHCAHVVGWKARRAASLEALRPLVETRALLEENGLPIEIVAGGSTGTWDI